MKTATHNGKVYQIGKLYFMGGEFVELLDIEESVTYPFKGVDRYYESISTVDARDLGTIEDAPIELEDGEWYMCEIGKNGYSYETPALREGDNWYMDTEGLRGIDPSFSAEPIYKMVKAT